MNKRRRKKIEKKWALGKPLESREREWFAETYPTLDPALPPIETFAAAMTSIKGLFDWFSCALDEAAKQISELRAPFAKAGALIRDWAWADQNRHIYEWGQHAHMG